MWYVSSPVTMSISQPSPDRLIFHPERRSTLARQLSYWVIILILLGGAGALIFLSGLCLRQILSKSFAVSYTAISNDIQTFISFSFAIGIIVVLAAISLYLSSCIFRFARTTKSSTFDRITSYSDRPNTGEVSIEQLDLFNRKKVIKIPFDAIVDLRLQYGAYPPSRDLQILLRTDRSIRPIVIGNFPHRFSKAESQRILQLIVEEVDKICDFVNLPIKPSYLVDGKGDYSVIALNHNSMQKISEHTSDILTFTSIFRGAARETWSFDLKSERVTGNYRLAILSFVKTIKTSEIKSIAIKRESSVLVDVIRDSFLLMPLNRKFLFELDRDRYSLIAILKDGSSFKCSNNYVRIFTSTDLITVREFAELIRFHLNLPDRSASEPNYTSRSERLTATKSS
jgi:hypothetical protein